MTAIVSDVAMVVGIDPSLTATGVVRFWRDAGEGSLTQMEVHRIPSKPMGKSVAARFGRYRVLAHRVQEVAGKVAPLICIEGYSFGSRGSAGISLGEFGGVLRLSLLQQGATIFEVPPATLKKFVLGRGVGDKSEMRLGVYKRWGVEFKSDDEVDAYGLARLGCCLAGWDEPVTQAQREAVATCEKLWRGD